MIHLTCDHCLKRDDDREASKRGFVEVRGIVATNTSEIHRQDYALAQVHLDCLGEWLTRYNARYDEVPF